MDLRSDMSMGDRLKVARRAAGLTQEQLAERASVNVDTIRKLEQNQRQSMRVTTANALASVVGVETTALLLGTLSSEARQDPQLQLIRRAMIPADLFAPADEDREEDTAPALDGLRQSVEDAWTLYHSGDFGNLGGVLPGLITEARLAVREHANGTAADAHAALAKVLQLAAHTMVQNQMEDLALLGLDQALAAARRSGDPLLPAMITNSVVWVFLRTGRLNDSERASDEADAIVAAFTAAMAPGSYLILSSGTCTGTDTALIDCMKAAYQDSTAVAGRTETEIAAYFAGLYLVGPLKESARHADTRPQVISGLAPVRGPERRDCSS
jgi:transcriptional regulator with XRE-family HTH domain